MKLPENPPLEFGPIERAINFIYSRSKPVVMENYEGTILTQRSRGFMDEKDMGYCLLFCAIFKIPCNLGPYRENQEWRRRG